MCLNKKCFLSNFIIPFHFFSQHLQKDFILKISTELNHYQALTNEVFK